MTKINELKETSKQINITAEIVEKGNTLKVYIASKSANASVCKFLVTDNKKDLENNSITLTLWNEHCDMFRVGDKVKITNGYITTYKGQLQLNVGFYGKIELL